MPKCDFSSSLCCSHYNSPISFQHMQNIDFWQSLQFFNDIWVQGTQNHDLHCLDHLATICLFSGQEIDTGNRQLRMTSVCYQMMSSSRGTWCYAQFSNLNFPLQVISANRQHLSISWPEKSWIQIWVLGTELSLWGCLDFNSCTCTGAGFTLQVVRNKWMRQECLILNAPLRMLGLSPTDLRGRFLSGVTCPTKVVQLLECKVLPICNARHQNLI